MTAFFQRRLPTGQYQQDALSPIIPPTIAYGKGYGNFDLQGTLGISLPTGSEATIGRKRVPTSVIQENLAGD